MDFLVGQQGIETSFKEDVSLAVKVVVFDEFVRDKFIMRDSIRCEMSKIPKRTRQIGFGIGFFFEGEPDLPVMYHLGEEQELLTDAHVRKDGTVKKIKRII